MGNLPGSIQRAQALADRLVEALARHLDDEGNLWDPCLGAPTPAAHYGNTSASVALATTGDVARAQRPLRAWLAVPDERLGHFPFNRLMLNFARPLLGDAAVAHGYGRCRLRRHYPSNNWGLLAQLCRVIESAGARQRRSAVGRFCCLLDRWTTPDGGFVDYPPRPRGRVATPIAYHHKALFLAATAAWFADSPSLTGRVERLRNWLTLVWDGDGFAGGFGRSTHSLFGDGCLLAALVLLAGAREEASLESGIIRGITERLERQFRRDGLLDLTPGDAAGNAGVWDSYMALSVYNAWTAAVLSWACRQVRSFPVPECLRAIPARNATPCWQHDDVAGVLRHRSSGGLTTLLSTVGQPPQAFARSEVELRYAGGVPFHVNYRGRVVAPAARRVDADAVRGEPALAGWTPLFLSGDRLFALTDFPSVAMTQSGEWLTVTLTGSPVAVTKAPVKRTWGRLRAAIDWRVLGGRLGRRDAFRREVLQCTKGWITFHIHNRRSCLAVEVRVVSRATRPVRYLNPFGHLLAEMRHHAPTLHSLTHCTSSAEWAALNIDRLSRVDVPTVAGPAVGYRGQAYDLTPEALTRWTLTLGWSAAAARGSRGS